MSCQALGSFIADHSSSELQDEVPRGRQGVESVLAVHHAASAKPVAQTLDDLRFRGADLDLELDTPL